MRQAGYRTLISGRFHFRHLLNDHALRDECGFDECVTAPKSEQSSPHPHSKSIERTFDGSKMDSLHPRSRGSVRCGLGMRKIAIIPLSSLSLILLLFSRALRYYMKLYDKPRYKVHNARTMGITLRVSLTYTCVA